MQALPSRPATGRVLDVVQPAHSLRARHVSSGSTLTPCAHRQPQPPAGSGLLHTRRRFAALRPRASAFAEAPAPAWEQEPPAAADGGCERPPPSSPQRPELAAELPEGLREVTAVLSAPNPDAPGGRTLVYVLGMSHVSRRSVEHVEQLIRMVRRRRSLLCSARRCTGRTRTCARPGFVYVEAELNFFGGAGVGKTCLWNQFVSMHMRCKVGPAD